jgi:hypothetical protein
LLYRGAAVGRGRVAPQHAFRHRVAYGRWCGDMGPQGRGGCGVGKIWVRLAIL